jgi:hypothetical protein
MPRLVAMPYIEYTFTDEEMSVAAVFTELQIMYLETQLALAARQRAVLAYDPDSPNGREKFLLESEYIRGEIETLQLLLSTSQDFKDRQMELLKRKIESQQQDMETYDPATDNE